MVVVVVAAAAESSYPAVFLETSIPEHQQSKDPTAQLLFGMLDLRVAAVCLAY